MYLYDIVLQFKGVLGLSLSFSFKQLAFLSIGLGGPLVCSSMAVFMMLYLNIQVSGNFSPGVNRCNFWLQWELCHLCHVWIMSTISYLSYTLHTGLNFLKKHFYFHRWLFGKNIPLRDPAQNLVSQDQSLSRFLSLLHWKYCSPQTYSRLPPPQACCNVCCYLVMIKYSTGTITTLDYCLFIFFVHFLFIFDILKCILYSI